MKPTWRDCLPGIKSEDGIPGIWPSVQIMISHGGDFFFFRSDDLTTRYCVVN